ARPSTTPPGCRGSHSTPPSRTSATGTRCARPSPTPSCGGSRGPRSATTPTPSATSSARWSAGPPASRSPRSWPGRGWAGRLGVAGELWFGMPASEQHRLAPLEDEPGAAEAAAQMMASLPPDLPMFKAGPPESFPNVALGNRPDVLAADIPAGGKTSARAIARMYAALLGEVDGVRLLAPERLAEAT